MRHKFLLLLLFPAILFPSCAHCIQVTSVTISGNSYISDEEILNVVDTKPGMILSRDVLQADIEAICDQGFFLSADFDAEPDGDGAAVTFSVTENPLIGSISFTGNTIYTSEQLMREFSSQAGTIFNRYSFRADLERVQDKYHKDGYVMARVYDVQIDGGNISITLLEPRVRNVTIQGSTKIPTDAISHIVTLKEGDPFNIVDFKDQLKELKELGYFEDINVAFDVPDDSDEWINIIITVKDKEP